MTSAREKFEYLEDIILILYQALEGKPLPYEWEVPRITEAIDYARKLKYYRNYEREAA